MDNNRPTALITGGSKGLGLELALEFARHDHDLILVARNEQDLRQASAKIRSESATNVSVHALDLTDDAALQVLFSRLADTRIDVLVNNAGVGDYGPFAQSDGSRISRLLQLNVVSLTRLTHHFIQPMLERGTGRILNVSSLVAFYTGGPAWVSYVASKAYGLSFSRGLAAELRGSGVSVTALCPGGIKTDFVEDAKVADLRVYRWFPLVTAQQAAKVGYRATMAGRVSVVPGVLNKIFAFLGELHPRIIAQTVFAFLSRPVR